MAKRYIVSLQLGKSYKTVELFADKPQDIIDLYKKLSLYKVKKITEVVYYDTNFKSNIDDPSKYINYAKILVTSNKANSTLQVVINAVKKNVSEADIQKYLKQYIKIGNNKIDEIVSSAWNI